QTCSLLYRPPRDGGGRRVVPYGVGTHPKKCDDCQSNERIENAGRGGTLQIGLRGDRVVEFPQNKLTDYVICFGITVRDLDNRLVTDGHDPPAKRDSYSITCVEVIRVKKRDLKHVWRFR